MRPDQLVLLAFPATAAVFLAARISRAITGRVGARGDLERLRAVDREWTDAVARWLR